jgi:hypothetical protein
LFGSLLGLVVGVLFVWALFCWFSFCPVFSLKLETIFSIKIDELMKQELSVYIIQGKKTDARSM